MDKQKKVNISAKVTSFIALSILAAFVLFSLLHGRHTGVYFPWLNGFSVLPLRHWVVFLFAMLVSASFLYMVIFRIDVVKRLIGATNRDNAHLQVAENRNSDTYARNHYQDFVYTIVSGLISLCTALYVLNIFQNGINAPFTYLGDAFGSLLRAQNFITGNGRYLFPNIGAPGIANLADNPGLAHLQHFWKWFLSFFVDESATLVNVYFISNFFFAAAFTTFALRLLNIQPVTSIMGGVLYAFLPYHFFRGVSHLFLTSYAMIPLVCLVALWICNGELNYSKLKILLTDFKVRVSFITAIMLALSETTLALYACLVIVFAILWNIMEFKKWKKYVIPMGFLVVICIVMFIGWLPHLIYTWGAEAIGTTPGRTPQHVEDFALRFAELVLPVSGHRIPQFDYIKSFYGTNVSMMTWGNTESLHSSTLGIFISLGFIISFFLSVKNINDRNIKNSAILNVFMFVLGTVGGISAVIGIFFYTLRTYNRLSVLIAFYSLFIMLVFFDKALSKIRLWCVRFRLPHRVILVFLVAVIGVFAVLDQVPSRRDGRIFALAINNHFQTVYNADRRFVEQIEELTPEGSMVFQLPFIPPNWFRNYHDIGIYEHFRPVIHSRTLRWSYGARYNSLAAQWQHNVATMQTEQMLRHIAANGFRGVYIDSRGYTGDDAQTLIDEIYSITGVSPIVSEHGFMHYFNIGTFTDNLIYSLSEEQQRLFQWNLGYWKLMLPVVPFDSVVYVGNQFFDTLSSGWSWIEDWGVWSDGYSAELEFSIMTGDVVDRSNLEVTFGVRSFVDQAFLAVYINENFVAEYVLSGDTHHTIVLPFSHYSLAEADIAKGYYNFIIRFEIANPISPYKIGISDDTRDLGVGLEWFIVSLR